MEGENALAHCLNLLKQRSPEGYEVFNNTFQKKTCKKGDFIHQVGQVSRNVYILDAGAAKIFRYKDDGTEHIIWFTFEGDLFTVLRSFVTGVESVEGIEALEDCEYRVISRDLCMKLFEKHRAIETFFRELTEYYYIESEERLFFLQALSAKQKYLYLLEHFPHFLQRLPQKDISSFLGITRETFSRIRKYALK